MTFTLYWGKRTGAFAPAAVLAEAGQTWTGIYVDYHKQENQTETYRRLNPLARIPTLILPDGSVMTESAAMVLHLAELFPAAGLLPPVGDPARAQLFRWLFFSVANVYEADLRESYPQRYTADPAGAGAVERAANRHIDELWDILAAVLDPGPFFLGERYSLMDPYLAMLAAWHREPKALFARQPAVARLVERVTARPAIAPLWRQFELDARL